MDSIKVFTPKRNKSFVYKNLNLSIIDENKKDCEDLLLKSNNTQSDSTTIEDKKENNCIIKSLSEKTINSTKININNEKYLKLIFNKPDKALENVNENSKKLNIIENKDISLKESNNKQMPNNNCCKKDIKIMKKHRKNIILKAFPPEINDFHEYKSNLIIKNNNCNNNVFRPKLPNVFINHLILKNSINNNTDTKYIQFAMTNRIQGKKLTILYYRPSKKE